MFSMGGGSYGRVRPESRVEVSLLTARKVGSAPAFVKSALDCV